MRQGVKVIPQKNQYNIIESISNEEKHGPIPWNINSNNTIVCDQVFGRSGVCQKLCGVP